jgi:hypothetical protein
VARAGGLAPAEWIVVPDEGRWLELAREAHRFVRAAK